MNKPCDATCEGAQSAKRITDIMAETAAALHGRPLAEDRENMFREYMRSVNAGFTGDLDIILDTVSYECIFDCAQCLGRVVLSVGSGVGEIHLAPGCPNYDQEIDVINND